MKGHYKISLMHKGLSSLSDGGCTHKDKTYKNGMEWREGCDTRCSCRNGRVNCSNICTAMTTQRPNCAYAVPAQVADTCCKEWVCYDSEL